MHPLVNLVAIHFQVSCPEGSLYNQCNWGVTGPSGTGRYHSAMEQLALRLKDRELDPGANTGWVHTTTSLDIT